MALAGRALSAVRHALSLSSPPLLCLFFLCLSLVLLIFAPAQPMKLQELSLLAGAAPPRTQSPNFSNHSLLMDQWEKLGSRQAQRDWLETQLSAIDHRIRLHHAAQGRTLLSGRVREIRTTTVTSVLGVLGRSQEDVTEGEAVLLHVPAGSVCDACSVALGLQLVAARAAVPVRGKHLVFLFEQGGRPGLRQSAEALLRAGEASLGGVVASVAGGLHAALSIACEHHAGRSHLDMQLRGAGAHYPNLDLGAAALAAAAQHGVHASVDGVAATRGSAARGYTRWLQLQNVAVQMLAQARGTSTANHAPLLDLGIQAMSVTGRWATANHAIGFSAIEEMLQYLDNLKHHFNLSFMLYIPCGDWHVSVGSYGPALLAASLAGFAPAATLWVQHGGWRVLLTEGTSTATRKAQTARKWIALGALAVAAALWVASGALPRKALLASLLLAGLLLSGAHALTGATRINRPSHWLRFGLLFMAGAVVLAFAPFNAGLALTIALCVTIPVGILLPYWPRCAAVSASLLWLVLGADAWLQLSSQQGQAVNTFGELVPSHAHATAAALLVAVHFLTFM